MGPEKPAPRTLETFLIRGSKGTKAFECSLSQIGPSLMSWTTSISKNIPIVPLYFAREREAVVRNGSLVLIHSKQELFSGEEASW